MQNEEKCEEIYELQQQNHLHQNKIAELGKFHEPYSLLEELIIEIKNFCNKIVMYFSQQQRKEREKEFPMLRFDDEKKEDEEGTLAHSKAFKLFNTIRQIKMNSDHLVFSFL